MANRRKRGRRGGRPPAFDPERIDGPQRRRRAGRAEAHVAVFAGAGRTSCAGSDLKAMAAGELPMPTVDGPPPLGPTRMCLTKPMIAAIDGGG